MTRHVSTALLVLGLALGAAQARPNDPDMPAIERPVHLTDRSAHLAPYVPVYRTTHDGRVGFNFKLGIRLYLVNPEKVQTNFHESPNGPALLASTAPFSISKSQIHRSNRDVQNHIGVCERPNDRGEFTNPRACGNEDCYDVVFMTASLEPGTGNRRQLWGTSATIHVSNPKTPEARISNVEMGTPVGGNGRFTFSELFEPMFTADGNLMVGRIQNAQINWNNRRTGANITGNYDMVYFPAPRDYRRACDVNQWDEIKPLGHAPYDPEINQTYGFAAQPFRDSLGNVIADNTDLAGTYPWIDSKGNNIAFSSFAAPLEGDFPLSCVPGRACENIPANTVPLMGKTIVGLWTHGKMVLMDNLVNNIDYSQPQMEDGGHRQLDMYRAGTRADGSGSGLVRVGNGRDNGDNSGAGIPAGSAINTTFTESSENKLNYWANMKPVTPRDVVWHFSNGAASDEFVFDDYLYNNAFIVSSMVQAVRNDGTRVTQHNGLGNNPAQVQNAAASTRWTVPTHGNVVGGARIERVALGGIHGKGMWMTGNDSRLSYIVGVQPRNIRDANWHISLFVDARFDNDNTSRTLLTFPDRSELQLIGRGQIRYWSGQALHTVNLGRAIPNNGWAHIGVQMSNRNRTATLYYNGFALDTFTRQSEFFEMSQGVLFVGDNPNRAVPGFRGWLDELKVIAHESNKEEWCNHANGTLMGSDNPSGEWSALAESYPQASHRAISDLLAASGKRSFGRYVCYHNYSGDYRAYQRNIPGGYVSVRSDIHAPEGPLVHNQPRPDARQNEFCLSCHSDANKKGLRLDALNFNPNVIAARDPRRQPQQPYPRVFGHIPANWLGAGRPARAMVAPAAGFAIDELLLPSSGAAP
jgi:Concanavalin A-like lectin/glucanases superfamily